MISAKVFISMEAAAKLPGKRPARVELGESTRSYDAQVASDGSLPNEKRWKWRCALQRWFGRPLEIEFCENSA